MAQRVPAEYLEAWMNGPTTEYPFHLWTDGATWRAVEGHDFQTDPGTFLDELRVHGSKFGLSVKAVMVPKHEDKDGQVVIFRYEAAKDEWDEEDD
ncbi:hypothetical protein [Streptomyces sp. CCM_MD2014]|uniref:hypothetical protein n=1 Tax=Streptomyces sp. CCM_MD2014 TaxID=1561022 RepID=UPI00052AE58A|nr:hypothetical protein [Streptomyces sp. CCM_MD2014]AIV36412.1 hypothetical protein NI25_25475 [Streptomyces sp. CCM_MD2014]